MPLANERGQAMVEYLLATILAALVIGAAFAIFFAALRGYYGLLTFLVGLPVP
jgi:Flp pilus assembly pilin Flp